MPDDVLILMRHKNALTKLTYLLRYELCCCCYLHFTFLVYFIFCWPHVSGF